MRQDSDEIEKNKKEILDRVEKKTSIILNKALKYSIENIQKKNSKGIL